MQMKKLKEAALTSRKDNPRGIATLLIGKNVQDVFFHFVPKFLEYAPLCVCNVQEAIERDCLRLNGHSLFVLT